MSRFNPADQGDWHVPKDCELLDGQVVEMKTGAYKAWCAGQLLIALLNHCDVHDLGWVFPSTLGYRFFSGRCHLRKASVTLIRKGRLPNNRLSRGDATIPPDLAAHFVAPDDAAEFVAQKALDFLTNGARLFWVVYVEARTALVLRPDGSGSLLRENDFLDGEDVVPGFRCRVGDLFDGRETDADQPVHVSGSE